LKGFIVHNVDKEVANKKYKDLARRQESQPIKISEIKKAENLIGKKSNAYCFESLKETTIPLSRIISKPSYKKETPLPEKLFDILQGINKKRHSLHFLLDRGYDYSERVIDDYIFLKSIVDKYLVRRHDRLANFLGLPLLKKKSANSRL